MVERLLKAGANPNAGRESAVLSAARSGNVEVMKLLLAHGGDANAKEPARGQTALMWAVAEKHAGVARVLIDARRGRQSEDRPRQDRGRRGRRRRRDGRRRRTARTGTRRCSSPCVRATSQSVRLLADAGANVNDTAADGLSALVLATVRAHADIAMFLLDKGADANLAGAGYTALHWASGSWETELTVTSITPDREGEEWRTVAGLRERRIDLVKALLAHGADPNARIRRTPPRVGSSKNPGLPELVGATPFLIAAVGGAADVMRVLADHGADVRLTTSSKGTPLMAAAGLGRAIGEVLVPESDNLAAAKLLFELGARRRQRRRHARQQRLALRGVHAPRFDRPAAGRPWGAARGAEPLWRDAAVPGGGRHSIRGRRPDRDGADEHGHAVEETRREAGQAGVHAAAALLAQHSARVAVGSREVEVAAELCRVAATSVRSSA